MQHNSIIESLFAVIDEKNTHQFVRFLDDNCSFRFGNMPTVSGINNIEDFVGGFFDSIHSLKHDIEDLWDIPDGIVCHGSVSYTRHDKSVLTVPFSNIFKIKDEKIYAYLIFADTSQLYSP